MADKDELPAAEEDKPKEESKDDVKEKDEKKEDKDKAHKFRGPAKEDPGEGLPTYTPAEIEFKWNKEMKDKKSCDTLHMLYLLQLALNLVRLRTIERNKYFKSIGRSDRYINQLDNPVIIENFLNWHNKDKENNKFDGELLDKSEKLTMINNIISDIGGVKKGPATKIYTKLKKDVVIETTTWLELPQPKLKLKSKTYTKLYAGEKVLDECTVEDIVTLLTYVNPADEAWAPENTEEEKKQDDGKPIIRGVFQTIKWSNNLKKLQKPKPSALECEVLLNGSKDSDKGGAIRKSEVDKFKAADTSPEYRNNAKLHRRWEDLVVAFFRGEERKWEYDAGEFDIALPESDKICEDDANQIIFKGTDPKTLGPEKLYKDDESVPDKQKPYKPVPIDGAKFMKESIKELCQNCMNYLIPWPVQNKKNKPFNTKLRGGVNQILRELKKVYVQGILEAAAAQKK